MDLGIPPMNNGGQPQRCTRGGVRAAEVLRKECKDNNTQQCQQFMQPADCNHYNCNHTILPSLANVG